MSSYCKLHTKLSFYILAVVFLFCLPSLATVRTVQFEASLAGKHCIKKDLFGLGVFCVAATIDPPLVQGSVSIELTLQDQPPFEETYIGEANLPLEIFGYSYRIHFEVWEATLQGKTNRYIFVKIIDLQSEQESERYLINADENWNFFPKVIWGAKTIGEDVDMTPVVRVTPMAK